MRVRASLWSVLKTAFAPFAARVTEPGTAARTTRMQRRLFLLFLSVINVIAAVLIITVHASVTSRLRSEARNTYSAILGQAHRELETFIRNSLFYLGTFSMDEQVQDLLRASAEDQARDRLRLSRIQNALKRLKTRDQYIRSVYLFKYAPRMVVSDKGVYSDLTAFADHVLFTELEREDAAVFSRYRIRLSAYPEGQAADGKRRDDTLTLILPINIPDVRGSLAMNLHTAWFEDLFTRTMSTMAGDTYLLLDGERLAASSVGGDDSLAPPREILGFPPEGVRRATVKGVPVLVFSSRDPYGLVLSHVVAENAIYRNAILVRNTLIGLWIAIFLISLPFALRLQRIAHKPIGRLYEFLMSNGYIPDEASVRGEVESLIQTYKKLADTNLIYRRQLAGYRPLFDEMLLMNILAGSAAPFKQQSDYRRTYLSKFKGRFPYCVILEIDDFLRYARSSSIEKRGGDSAFMLKVLEKSFPSSKTVSHLLEDRIIIADARDSDAGHDPSLAVALTEAQKKIGAYLRGSVTIAVGRPVASARELRESYRAAETALERKFILGTGRILWYDDAPPASPSEGFDGDALKQLQAAVRTMNRARARDALHQVLGSVSPRANVKDAYAIASARILSALEGASVEARLEVPAAGEASDVVKRSETLADLHAWLADALESVFAQIELHHKAKNADYRAQVKALIEERHANPLLQISDVAERFNLSPTYFGRFFHELTGTSFTAYVNTIRLNHAAELLGASNLPVNEVGEKTGFNSTQYFIRVFKKRFRATPGDYRIQNQKSGTVETG